MLGIVTDVPKRDFLKIQVAPAEREAFTAVYTDKGMTQIEATTRLVRWFLDQDEVVQGTILRSIPQSVRVDVARLALERIAAEDDDRPIRLDSSSQRRASRSAARAKPDSQPEVQRSGGGAGKAGGQSR
jgi:hypothetical protein